MGVGVEVSFAPVGSNVTMSASGGSVSITSGVSVEIATGASVVTTVGAGRGVSGVDTTDVGACVPSTCGRNNFSQDNKDIGRVRFGEGKARVTCDLVVSGRSKLSSNFVRFY